MNSLNSLFFPGTDIYSIRQYPLFLLFQKIHLIRPVENNPVDAGDESTDSFIKSGFCQEHTPCPLGEHRNRFLHLVTDIKNRQDDYAAQLSSLVLASQSAPPLIDEDSEQAIMSSLLPPEESQAKDTKAKALLAEKEGKLWQARLVLAIGEILDQEEEEIARNLAILEDDQADLFKDLHGDLEEMEEDSPFAELSQLESNLGAANSGNIKKRFNGWKALFQEGDMPACEIFLTTSQDAGDILLELYEKKTNQSAIPMATLAIPGLIGWNSAEAFQAVMAFSEKNKELLATIQEELTALSQKKPLTGQEKDGNNAFAAITEQWHKQLELDFPEKQFGRIPVTYYLFQGLSCSAILGKTPSENGEPKNGVLVVVD